ncbi:MAG: DegT/DnrJ/EryC1/StrS aminotransferase family protein [Planctomycetota bacterium]
MRDSFLPLALPVIGEAEVEEVIDSLRSGWLTTGPKTKKFERLFRERLGVKHAVALSSCSAALHLAMLALDIEPGDEIITTPVTWPATSNMIWHAGAKPVFVDIERDTLNIDAAKLEEAITDKTRAIIPVHIAGQPCNMTEIHAVANTRGLPVIEDAAHALGSTYKGVEVGADGTHCCYSFYATKNMTTGEGGMFTTNDDEIAERVRVLSQHGVSRDAWNRERAQGPHWQLIEPGMKYNMSDLMSSIGIHQMDRLDGFIAKRRELASEYDRMLKGFEGVTPLTRKPERASAFHLYIVRLNPEMLGATRDELMIALREANIGVGVHFISTHLQPYYRERLGIAPESLPVAAALSEEILSLPIYPGMELSDVRDVVDAFRTVVAAQRAETT